MVLLENKSDMENGRSPLAINQGLAISFTDMWVLNELVVFR